MPLQPERDTALAVPSEPLKSSALAPEGIRSSTRGTTRQIAFSAAFYLPSLYPCRSVVGFFDWLDAAPPSEAGADCARCWPGLLARMNSKAAFTSAM